MSFIISDIKMSYMVADKKNELNYLEHEHMS